MEILGCPMNRGLSKLRFIYIAFSCAMITFLCLMLIVFSWAWSNYDSTSAAVALISGQSLVLEPKLIDVGFIQADESASLDIRAYNLTKQRIFVIGFGAYCGTEGCINSDDSFPKVIEPHSTQKLTLRYSGPMCPNCSFQLVAEIYTQVGTFEVVVKGQTNPSTTFNQLQTPE